MQQQQQQMQQHEESDDDDDNDDIGAKVKAAYEMYNSQRFKKDSLEDLCEVRDIPKSGLKANLAMRLARNDFGLPVKNGVDSDDEEKLDLT